MDSNTIKLFSSKATDHWATPEDVYKKLDDEFHFTFDPCPLNSDFDGLQVPWVGNIFVNPPYSNIKGFLKKAHNELENGNAKVVVFLVFSNTDTAWFHDYVYHKAELRFLRGRIHFIGLTKTVGHAAMRPSMLAIFRSDNVRT